MASNVDFLSSDKLLFAVDLVDHVIIRTRPNFGNKTSNILARADRLRNFTYNHFDKTIKNALNIIDINQDSSVFGDFQKMMKGNVVNKESFIKYGTKYKELHLSGEFDPKLFLKYCVRIANMAGYFLSYGVDDAADVAVELIMKAFPPTVMYHEDWNKLTNVAETLVVLGNKYFGDETSSDSESVDLSENEDTSSDSVNMDVSSPDDDDNNKSRSNLNVASVFLKEISERANSSKSSSRTDLDSGSKLD